MDQALQCHGLRGLAGCGPHRSPSPVSGGCASPSHRDGTQFAEDLGLALWVLDHAAALHVPARAGSRHGQNAHVRDPAALEGLRWRKQEGWFGERIDPEFAEKRGPSNSSAVALLNTV